MKRLSSTRFLSVLLCFALTCNGVSVVLAQPMEPPFPANVVTMAEGMPPSPPAMQPPSMPDSAAVPSNAKPNGDISVPGYDPVQASLRLEDALARHIKISKPAVNPGDMPTLFFTLWQHALLQEAKVGLMTRAPTQAELENGDSLNNVRGIREISVGGIMFKAAEEWTVWLNGQRVTPQALPREVMDIKVGRDFIELKWFDSYSNQIYPIRIGAHQRFNLDTRIFLPGIGDQVQ